MHQLCVLVFRHKGQNPTDARLAIHQPPRKGADDTPPVQQQIDVINERLENLTNLFLTLDRRIKPLYETIRLTYEKSEVLNQRINALIDSIRMGEPL